MPLDPVSYLHRLYLQVEPGVLPLETGAQRRAWRFEPVHVRECSNPFSDDAVRIGVVEAGLRGHGRARLRRLRFNMSTVKRISYRSTGDRGTTRAWWRRCGN